MSAKRQPPPRISAAEWTVMRLLWTLEKATARDVARDLALETSWSDRTVKTMLSRLVKKGVVDFEVVGQHYLYFPARTREECEQAESDAFVERVFGGAVGALLAGFVRRGKLTQDEIRELRELLDEESRP